MQIEFPNAQPLTPEDEAHLESLKAVIEQVVKDGVLTGEEIALVHDKIASNKKLLPEEILMVQNLIREKIAAGELEVSLFENLYR